MTRQAFPVLTCDVAVATTAAERAVSLDGVDTSNLASGHFAVITSGSFQGRMYRLDAASALTPDGASVIAPVAGVGRWLQWPGAGGGGAATFSVDGIQTGTTQLVDVPTASLSSGATAYVDTIEDEFVFDPDSALTADGITVVDGNGGGQWLRRTHIGNQRWREQAEWHIDASTGNDENDGSAANPLASFAELRRRYGVNPFIPQSTQVFVESDLDETLFFDGTVTLDSGVIYRVTGGVRTVLATGTLDNVVTQDRGTQTPMRLDDAGIDAFVDRRVRFTDGAAAGATCWGFRSPAADQLDCVQSVTYDSTADPLPSGGTPVTPSAGDSYVIEELFQVGGINLTFERLTTPALSEDFIFSVEDLDVLSADGMFVMRAETLLGILVGSRVGSAEISSATRAAFTSCFVNSTTHLGRVESYGASLLKSDVGGVFFQEGAHCTLQGDTIMADGPLTFIESTLTLTDAAAFDSPQSGINLSRGSSGNVVSGTVWGDGNTDFGWDIRANSVVSYSTGNKPTLTGAGGDTQIGGAAVAYGSIPLFDTDTASGMVEDV